MSYEKQNFKNGDILYAEDLNDMDTQIESNQVALSSLDERATFHDSEIIEQSRNLLQAEYAIKETQTKSNIILSYDEKGWFSVSGKNISDTSSKTITLYSRAIVNLKKGQTYDFIVYTDGYVRDINSYFQSKNSDKSVIGSIYSSNDSGEITITPTEDIEKVTILFYIKGTATSSYDSNAKSLDGKVRFLLQKTNSSKKYTSIISSVDYEARGLSEKVEEKINQFLTTENLFDRTETRRRNNIQYDVNADGSIHIYGTSKGDFSYPIVAKAAKKNLQPGFYTFSTGIEEGNSEAVGMYLYYVYGDGEIISNNLSKGSKTFYIDKNKDYLNGYYYAGINVKKYDETKENILRDDSSDTSAVTVDEDNIYYNNQIDITVYPMLERGQSHTKYVSPKENSFLPKTAPLITEDFIKINKASAQANIRWTPLHYAGRNWTPNKECFGIPYHANLHILNRDVFCSRSIETFISATKNPASRIYTQVENGTAFYGGMCTSFTGWLCSQKKVKWSKELDNVSGEDYLVTYDYCGPDSLQAGDVLALFDGTTNHAMCVSQIDINIDTGAIEYITVIDTTPPGNRYKKYTLEEFEVFLKPDGVRQAYIIGRYPNQEIRNVQPLRYSTDIITEYGNNTYFKEGEDIWCWIDPQNNASNVYIIDKDLNQEQVIAVNNIPSKTVIVEDTSYTLYNLKNYINSSTSRNFEITTNKKLKNRLKIYKTYCGESSFNNDTCTFKIENASVQPKWCLLYFIDSKNSENSVYDQYNGGRTYSYDFNENEINLSKVLKENDESALVKKLGGSNGTIHGNFKIYVFFETPFGQVCQDFSFSFV